MTETQSAVPDFETMMSAAQLLHSQHHYFHAAEQFRAARVYAPDAIETGRALRGEAVSSYRYGEVTDSTIRLLGAKHMATEAAQIHDKAVLTTAPAVGAVASPDHVRALRGAQESHRVLGRMFLKSAIRHERIIGIAPVLEYSRAQRRFAQALGYAATVSEVTGNQLDQHDINLFADAAFGQMFGTDRSEARRFAGLARHVAWKSESPNIANSANLGFKHRVGAVAKAVYRAYAATAAERLVSMRRRRAALWVASLPNVH